MVTAANDMENDGGQPSDGPVVKPGTSVVRLSRHPKLFIMFFSKHRSWFVYLSMACLGLILFIIAAAIVVSLIPLYLAKAGANTGEQPVE